MSETSRKPLIRALLEEYGQSFAEELRIPLERNTPSVLFQWLCAALLLSARIPADNALRATRALIDAGLTSAQKMAEASWQERVDVLTAHGYKRYDESASSRLGDTANLLLDEYRGDLRRLRETAERDVTREKKLLMRFKGIGALGADIFLREVQIAWEEVYPHADERVLKAASHLGLGTDARELAQLVPRGEFVRLVAALIRTELHGTYDDIRARAGEPHRK